MPNLYTQAKPPRGRVSTILDLLADQLHPGTGTEFDRCIRTWQFGRGERADEIPLEKWTAELLPALRVDLDDGNARRASQGTLRAVVAAKVTIGLKGSDVRDAADYWEALARAVFREDREFLSKLNLQLCTAYSLDRLGFAKHRFENNAVGYLVQGALTFHFDIPAIL